MNTVFRPFPTLSPNSLDLYVFKDFSIGEGRFDPNFESKLSQWCLSVEQARLQLDFSQQNLPNSADLQFIKHVVSVIRKNENYELGPSQSALLNEIGNRLGHKTFNSLQGAAPSVLETVEQRQNKLPALTIWTLDALRFNGEDPITEEFDSIVLDIALAATKKPVFDITLDSFNGPVRLRMHCHGVLTMVNTSGLCIGFDASNLGLLAVAYTITPVQSIPPGLSMAQFATHPIEAQKDCVRVAYHHSPGVEFYRMDTLEDRYSNYEDMNVADAGFWLSSPHHEKLGQSEKILLVLPDMSGSDTLSTCEHVHADIQAHGPVWVEPDYENDKMGMVMTEERIRQMDFILNGTVSVELAKTSGPLNLVRVCHDEAGCVNIAATVDFSKKQHICEEFSHACEFINEALKGDQSDGMGSLQYSHSALTCWLLHKIEVLKHPEAARGFAQAA